MNVHICSTSGTRVVTITDEHTRVVLDVARPSAEIAPDLRRPVASGPRGASSGGKTQVVRRVLEHSLRCADAEPNELLMSFRLTRRAYYRIPTGLWLVSNVCSFGLTPMFAEAVVDWSQRAAQWRRIKLAEADQRTCMVFDDALAHHRWCRANLTAVPKPNPTASPLPRALSYLKPLSSGGPATDYSAPPAK